MSEDKFLTLQVFNQVEHAEAMKHVLEEKGMEVVLMDTSPPVDITFSGSTAQNEIRVMVMQRDFDQAEQILQEDANYQVQYLAEDHYLLEFTNEELIEILEEPDTWSREDVVFARKLLKDRGQEVDEKRLEEVRKARIEKLKQPETAPGFLLFCGYIFAFAGGLYGIYIGHSLWKSTKVIPTVGEVYRYNTASRSAGKNMFLIGITCFVIWGIILLLTWEGPIW